MKERKISFLAKRKVAFAFSILLFVASIFSLSTRGLNLGVDFTGGYLIEVGYPQAVEIEPIRTVLENEGVDKAIVQHFGTAKDVLIRLAPEQALFAGAENLSSAEVSDKVIAILKANDSTVSMRRVEFVGPQVGEELRDDGGLALLYALILISFYIWFRFEWKFSIGALLALTHDVIITIGIFSFTQVEFDLTVLAAILAVIGYSLNDTIVVYDRIRENFRKLHKETPEDVADISITQTLARTLVTSLTTMLVLLVLYFFGGEVINSFALALIVGVVVGTYSSIFVASASLIALGLVREDMMMDEKEEEELLNRP